jgi:twitching motility two-component system response regulator PilH
VDGKVLIVDDEADVATYMATVLRAHGHRVTIAKSVEAGLQSVSESRPDLICLDIMMPRESGISMYRRLKQNRETASIPVIVVSGVEPEGQFDFRSYLPNESVPPPECFLEKPLDVHEFVATVERLLTTNAK